MIKEIKFDKCQKFVLQLKQRTQRKRVLEAKTLLAGIYPFNVDIKNIIVLKTEKKGLYEVYISKEKIENRQNVTKWLVIVVLFIIIFLIGISLIQTKIKKNETASVVLKEQEAQASEKKRIQHEKEEKLIKLQNEFHEIELNSNLKIYPCLESIYSVMLQHSVIENISINKNVFSVEVTTPDAMKVLENFENNGSFQSVEMNRTVVNKDSETVIYNGNFTSNLHDVDSSETIDNKIEFYTRQLENTNIRRERRKDILLSEYISNIRNSLRENGCSEQYIQLFVNGKFTEVEFFILSSSKNILRFLSEIQEGEENLIDIKQIKIRNSSEREGVQTTIYFDSGIELKHNDENFSEYTNKKISASEIEKIFYKPSIKNDIVPVKKTSNLEKKIIQNQNNVNLKKLTYIGLTKIDGQIFILAKDEKMNTIYKLTFTDYESDKDSCIETEYGYKAKIRGEYYEVRK